MARYIDADKLIEHIKNMPWKMDSASEITKLIFLSTVEEAPAADVVSRAELSIVSVQNAALIEANQILREKLAEYKIEIELLRFAVNTFKQEYISKEKENENGQSNTKK
jgi:hypothetical protein